MFTQPDGLAILWRDTTVPEALLASGSAVVGITALVAGVSGYLLRPTNIFERALLIVGGILLMVPGLIADLGGIALFAAAALSQLYRRARDAAPARARPV
jgi:TRAP-type uncharacterized transport system fused permease subunit